MTYQVLQGWALIVLAISGPPCAAWALSKFWFWNGYSPWSDRNVDTDD